MPSDHEFVSLLRARLLPVPPVLPHTADLVPDWTPSVPIVVPPVPAAVLVGLIARPEGLTVLYTQRAATLRAHSGQVAFPGGKVDAGDADVAAAALREAGEEVALFAEDAEVIGFMAPYYTGTNYLITPVVALVRPSRPFVPSPAEVHAIFEVPLRRIADPQSFGRFEIARGGVTHSTWQIDHDGHRIWGITANLTRRLHDLLREEGA